MLKYAKINTLLFAGSLCQMKEVMDAQETWKNYSFCLHVNTFEYDLHAMLRLYSKHNRWGMLVRRGETE